jgi:hypothetical protein
MYTHIREHIHKYLKDTYLLVIRVLLYYVYDWLKTRSGTSVELQSLCLGTCCVLPHDFQVLSALPAKNRSSADGMDVEED